MSNIKIVEPSKKNINVREKVHKKSIGKKKVTTMLFREFSTTCNIACLWHFMKVELQ